MVTYVSAFVYQQSTKKITQNIVEISTITLKNSDLGYINEGETKAYTSSEVASLGEAITITTTIAPVYLNFNSDVDSLCGYYSTYNINVLYNTDSHKGTGSETACSMSLTSPDTSDVTLDEVGTWVFDLLIEITADSVDSNTQTSVTITVFAESTN